MKDTIRAKLESTRDRFEEVSGLLAEPEIIGKGKADDEGGESEDKE